MNTNSHIDSQIVNGRTPEADSFAGIRKQLNQTINILHPNYKEAVQKADQQGYLNGELPAVVRELVKTFIPTTARDEKVKTPIIPQKKNLSRKERKLQKEKNLRTPAGTPTSQYSQALDKVQSQVFDYTRLSTQEVIGLLGNQSATQPNTFNHKKNLRILSDLPIPAEVLDGADSRVVDEYATTYLSQTESLKLSYNFVKDIINGKIISKMRGVIANNTIPDELNRYRKMSVIQGLMEIAAEIKNLFLTYTFVDDAVIQPSYIKHIIRQQLINYNLLRKFENQLEIGLDEWLRGIYAEAYGVSCMEYFVKRGPQDSINVNTIAHFDTVKSDLDLHAKSDDQFYLTLPSGNFVLSIDFKSRAGGYTSMERKHDELYHVETIRSYLPVQLASYPIICTDFHIGTHASYQGKLYTPKVYQDEFEKCYDTFVSHLGSRSLLTPAG